MIPSLALRLERLVRCHFPLGSMEEMGFAKPSLFVSTFSCTTNLKFPVIFDMMPNVSQIQRIMFRVLLKMIIKNNRQQFSATNSTFQWILLYQKKPNYITASLVQRHFASKISPCGVAGGKAPSSQNSAKVSARDAASTHSTRGVFWENSAAAIFVVQELSQPTKTYGCFRK